MRRSPLYLAASDVVAPYYSDDWLTVFLGDCREVMATMPAESVHCVVTSPPYWGLRDYGHAGQLGLEPTPEEYVANMVDVFREVRRVLRADGTVWLNLGDSYASTNAPGRSDSKGVGLGTSTGRSAGRGFTAVDRNYGGRGFVPYGLKSKDLVGIPWRVAFALQADGWYLRSDIIWSKPNPMPESVTDRPTKSHEYLFLLSKSPRYYFDADAVREDGSPNTTARPESSRQPLGTVSQREALRARGDDPLANGSRSGLGLNKPSAGRNIRSVWTIATQPYPGAHFATFPRKLVEPCIKAGSPEGGVVLDCFAGSGTTGMVAQSLSRKAVLIDLNGDYLGQTMARNADIPLGLGA